MIQIENNTPVVYCDYCHARIVQPRDGSYYRKDPQTIYFFHTPQCKETFARDNELPTSGDWGSLDDTGGKDAIQEAVRLL